MSGEQAFDLSVRAGLESLEEIRAYIDRAGESLGVESRDLDDLRLAVDEAVTNIIVHGYGNAPGEVNIHMQADGDAVVIRIRDRARHFHPDHVRAPQLDVALHDRPAGGMGIFLIRKLTDQAEFHPLPGGGNELRLVKRGAIQTQG